MPAIDTSDRSDVAIIAAVGDANMTKTNLLSKCRIERKPLAISREDFYPGVRGLAADHFFLLRFRGFREARDQITGDVARGNTLQAYDAQEYVGEILANAHTERERICNRR